MIPRPTGARRTPTLGEFLSGAFYLGSAVLRRRPVALRSSALP
jgi:hypothetical protein